MRRKVPLPGTQEAIDQGCICPVIDNRERPKHLLVYTVGCPVHHTPSGKPRLPSKRRRN